MKIIKAVPTNIVTGALGAGKTSLIKALLKSKPEHERWAVLVNEFGEIGIDGALLNAEQKALPEQAETIFIREIPGGCMCCTSGLPMQIALNQLLASAKPDRLLIEPTGLGHPKELIEVLGSHYYRNVVSLNTTMCLIDARKLHNSKWRLHSTFKEQVEIADVVIATKYELYTESDWDLLQTYLQEVSLEHPPLIKTNPYSIKPEILYKNSKNNNVKNTDISFDMSILRQHRQTHSESSQESIDGTSVVRKHNEGEGFYSHGWIWGDSHCFEHNQLIKVLSKVNATRIKAVMISNKGALGFNGQDGDLEISDYNEARDSRLEIITESKEELKHAVALIEKEISAI